MHLALQHTTTAWSEASYRTRQPTLSRLCLPHCVTIAAMGWHQLALSAAGSTAKKETDITVPPGFANFHGVTVEAMIWLDKTATVRNQQHFDDVAQRKYYVDMFRLQAPSVSAALPPAQQQSLYPFWVVRCTQSKAL